MRAGFVSVVFSGLALVVGCGGGGKAADGAIDRVDAPVGGAGGMGGVGGQGGGGADGGGTDLAAAADGASDRAADAAADRGADGSAPGDAAPAACGATYVGNPAWKNQVQFTAAATVMCVNWTERRLSLQEELQAKAMLRIAAGTYLFPDTTGPAPFALPICIERADRPTLASGTGTVTYMTETIPGFGWYPRFDVTFPVVGAAGSVAARIYSDEAPATGPLSFTIDGSNGPPTYPRGDLYIGFCPAASCASGGGGFEPCTFSRGGVDQIAFDGGTLEVERRFGQASGGLHDPTAFIRATGSFMGVPVDQRNYYKLVFHAKHHLVDPELAVLFDAPIAGACGVAFTYKSDFSSGGAPKATGGYTTDCALNRLTALTNVRSTLGR